MSVIFEGNKEIPMFYGNATGKGLYISNGFISRQDFERADYVNNMSCAKFTRDGKSACLVDLQVSEGVVVRRGEDCKGCKLLRQCEGNQGRKGKKSF